MKLTTPITSSDIRIAMLNRFGGNEWAIMWEVAPATGYSHGKTRYADAVMMSLWPSRGLDLHGVEIKISRSDWKREAADPEKAERIAAYCDFWWVHTAPSVIQDLSEVPMTWGVREWDGKTWKTLREATRTPAQALDRAFLASLLRRTEDRQKRDIEDEVEKRVRKVRDDNEVRIKSAVEERTRHNAQALEDIKMFETSSGISMKNFRWHGDPERLGKAVKLILDADIDGTYNGIKTLAENVGKASSRLRKALAEFETLSTEGGDANRPECSR